MTEISDHDLDMATRTVLSEAGDNSDDGQAAVANVIRNRLERGSWGNTPTSVVMARKQFEPWSLPKDNPNHPMQHDPASPEYRRTADIVRRVFSGEIPDNTQGSTLFYDPSQQSKLGRKVPAWAKGAGITVGSHRFYPSPEARARAAAASPGEEDLISEWGAGTPKASAAAAVPAEEDLLSEWMPKAAPAKPAPVTPATAAAPVAPGGHETLPQYVNRLTRENPDSTAIRLGAGAMRGVGDVGDTLAQGIAATGDVGAGVLSRLGIISPESAKAVADWRTGVNAGITEQNKGFEVASPGAAGEIGRVGGQIAGTGPFLSGAGSVLGTATRGAPLVNAVAARPVLSTIAKGAGIGAGTNLLTSASSDVPLREQVMTGGAIGGALGPVARGAGKLFGASVDRETAALAKRATDLGIPLRVDQISANPMARFGGSVLQRLPFTGLGGHVAKQQAAFGRAVAKTFGEDADALTPDVMAGAKARIGNVFDTTLPQLETHLNPKLSARIQAISDATQYLPQEDGRIVQKHIDDVLRQFTGVSAKVGAPTRVTGVARMDGDQLQALITKGSPLDRAISGGSSNVKYLASELKNALLDSVGQTATGRAKTAAGYVQKLQAFKEARYQYKNMKTVEDLAEKSPTGDISPALLMGQVRQSFGNMAYGGGGDLADLARIGQRFLKEPPSSGTAERLKIFGALGAGAAGLGGAYHFDPEGFQRDALGLGAAMLAARTGGAALKSKQLGKLMIRSGMSNSPGRFNELLSRTLPALAPRQNPLALPPPSPAQ